MTDAESRAGQAEQDATRARHAEAAAVTRAEHAQAAAADETARIRADHQHPLDQLTTATNARITALGETRDALRIRAERAESDLDAARAENQRLAERLTQATDAEAAPEPADTSSPLPRTTSRVKKASATQGTTSRGVDTAASQEPSAQDQLEQPMRAYQPPSRSHAAMTART